MAENLSDEEFLKLLEEAESYDSIREIIDQHMTKKLQAAENGDVDAMRFYAKYYSTCYLPDLGKVEIYWYKKIVEATGDVNLMNYIGEFCDYRQDPEDNDMAESIKYLNMAIERGDLKSVYAMAWNYYNGVDTRKMKYYHNEGFEADEVVIPEDKEKALEYFMRAANGGYGEAMSTLGLFYARGELVEKDLEKSLYWFDKAVKAGDEEAAYQIGKMLENGEEFEKDLTAAVEWYKKGAEIESLSCSYKLGLIYSRGEGVEPDEYEAEKYFLQAANNTKAFHKEKMSLGCYGERSSAQRELAKIYLSRTRKLLFPSTFFDFDPLATPIEKNVLNLCLEMINHGDKHSVEFLGYYFLELARTLFEKSEEKNSNFGSLDAFIQSRTEIAMKKYDSQSAKTFKFEDLDDFLKYLSEIAAEKGDTEIQKQIETAGNFEKSSEE